MGWFACFACGRGIEGPGNALAGSGAWFGPENVETREAPQMAPLCCFLVVDMSYPCESMGCAFSTTASHALPVWRKGYCGVPL